MNEREMSNLIVSYMADEDFVVTEELEGKTVGYRIDRDCDPNTLIFWVDGATFLIPLHRLISLSVGAQIETAVLEPEN